MSDWIDLLFGEEYIDLHERLLPDEGVHIYMLTTTGKILKGMFVWSTEYMFYEFVGDETEPRDNIVSWRYI